MITAYILGIATVAVILIGVVAVLAFVRVNKANREISDYQREFYQTIERVEREIETRNNSLQQHIDTEAAVLHRRIEDLEREIYSSLDSRLDKLENKFTTKK